MALNPVPDAVAADLAAHGLKTLGLASDDERTIALIGPNGGAMWPHFTASREAADGRPDPLDRWSMRVIGAIAERFEYEALYPFGGPPWHPFIAWALASGQIFQSPVPLLVHATEGLFVSFRGAFRLPGTAEPAPATPPCDTCAQPCRTACPVGALTAEGYDVAACRTHVASDAGVACRNGCLVRRACPVGQGLRSPEQSAFHMRAFLGSPP